jgi:hypothetical protein
MEDKKMKGGLMKHPLQTFVHITPAYSGRA